MLDQFSWVRAVDQVIDDLALASRQLLNDVFSGATDSLLRAVNTVGEHQDQDGIGEGHAWARALERCKGIQQP